MAELVFNALCRPVLDSFCLAQLDDQDRLHEMEFVFPATSGVEPAGMRLRDGFLTGFIDLIFRRDGRYYVLDWKSNYLPGGYTPEQLDQAMTAADYHLQYKVYVIAMLRWLNRVCPDFDYDDHFGGVLYVFLRGVDGRGNGVFFHRPEGVDELAAYRDELAALFAAGREEAV